MRLARARIAAFVGRGDMDGDALSAEAKALDAALTKIAAGEDPYAGRTGVLRMAYVSPADGELSEYGLYVPPSYKPGGTKHVSADRGPARPQRQTARDAALVLRRRRRRQGPGLGGPPPRAAAPARGLRPVAHGARQHDVPRSRRRRRHARPRSRERALARGPRPRDHHRPVDGRHRRRRDPPPPPGPLRRGGPAVRLPQLLRPARRAAAAPSVRGSTSSPRSAPTSSGRSTAQRFRSSSCTARRICPWRTARCSSTGTRS